MANPFESICVLVVEDDPVQFEIMEIYLRKLGIKKLLAAHNGKEAMDLLLDGSNAIQAVFTDKDMPMMDGIEFILEMREYMELKRIPVAMTTDNLTNQTNPSQAEHALRAFLQKRGVLALPKDGLNADVLNSALNKMLGL